MRAVRWLLVVMLCALATSSSSEAQSSPGWLSPYRDDAMRLIRAAIANDFAWRRLAEMTDTHGARLSGSDNLARAMRIGHDEG